MQCRLFPVLKTVNQSKQFFQCNFQQNALNVQQHFPAIKGQLEQPKHFQNSLKCPECNEQFTKCTKSELCSKLQSNRISTQVTTN